MRIWRSLVLLVVMLWLSMQGVAAVAMPFCMHALGDPGGVQMNGAHHDHELHNHHGNVPPTHHDQGSPMGFSCNDCGACHLACAPIAPCPAIAIVALVGHAYSPLPPTSVSLFIPEQPEPPPLSAIA